ncbi:family 78 glycoside hydrolase catalytic domain [Paenibacillus sp. KS-LC4]|uniref:family 78 glycoside hydrolase catalytic domain n=1 Tax=Paenibacillus sp. KS-LC4 TaxID=2979727 RepID=UPI0030CE2046
MKPVLLKIKNYASPIGIDTSVPIFSWQLQGTDLREELQTHYRVLVAKDESSLDSGVGLVWDSEKIISSNQLHITYKGQPLQSVNEYFWKVGVWDSNGLVTWSEVVSFVTGYLEGEPWKAKWIGNGGCKPFYARHSFELKARVKRAYAFVSGLGHFNFYMNGRKVGNHEMDPGWTNYHRSVQYVGFDVTDNLIPDSNIVGLHVGNGFFAGDSGGRHFYTMDKGYEPYGSQLMAIAELHIQYEDGSNTIICTDARGWKVRDSATTLANVYGSENVDARRYPNGWTGASYDDRSWEKAELLFPPAGKLTVQNQPPITVKHIYDTVQIDEPLADVFVFDLGQNMSGMFEIYVSGPAGSKVTIKPGELMREDGTIATPWDIVTYSEYILAGTGEVEIWKPDFSYYGARWVQIEGCTRDERNQTKPYIHDVKGHFVTSASLSTGVLETDDLRIGKLAAIITKAIESNLQSVHSDCPTIEKLGWIETAGLMGPSIMYVKDVEDLWLKIVKDMIEAQTEEGLVPDIAPEYSRFTEGFRDSIAWGSSIISVPNLLFETYGNVTAIELAYTAMKAYMSYLKSKEVNGGFINHGLGDWGIHPQTGGDYIENVETAIYYDNYRLMVKFAKMLGIHEDVEHYTYEAERIRSLYNELLLRPISDRDPEGYAYHKITGEFDPDNQVVQAIPLFLGLVPEDKRMNVETALLHAASSRQLRSGEIGLRFLFGALSDMKRKDIVFDMMMQPEHPSYIRFVEMGETALPEFWTDDARSRNHDMMGHILEWLYKDLLGISSISGAYKEISIAPYRAEHVKQIRGCYHSVRGPICVEFSHCKDVVSLSVQIPPNTTARVQIPLLAADSLVYEHVQSIEHEVIFEEGQPFGVVRVGSGRYAFRVVNASF